MQKQTFKLLGSAPTVEMLLKGVTAYFCGSDIRFEGTIGLFQVHNSKGRIEGFRVIKKGSRYRFEMEVQ